MNKKFSEIAWKEYTEWQAEDKKILKKINEMIKDIDRNGNEGLGHPEALRHELTGYWSRKITEKDRLIYRITEDGTIYIIQCKNH